MIKELPKGWEWKKLGDICEIIGGKPAPKGESFFKNGDIPFIRMQDLGRYHLTTNLVQTKDKINKEYALKNGFKLVKKGSLLLPRSGSVSLNHRAILGADAFIVSHICALTIKDIGINNLFLYYILSRIDMRKIMKKTTGLDAITFEDLKNLKIPLPPLPTQKKIVEILEKAEKLKTHRKNANAETNKILQSVFLEMFGDPVKNEKGWDVKKLREVCEINPKKSEIAELDDNTEITFLPMVSVSEEGKILNKEIKKLGDVRKGFTYFKEKDVLFAKITPCMENGKRAIVTELKNGIGFGTTEFHVIRAKENINPYWVFGLISLEKFRKIAEINMTGTAGQKRVPTDFLKNFRVPIPPLPLQNQFAEIVEKVEKIKERQKDSTKEINDLFNALMQKAFKGELD